MKERCKPPRLDDHDWKQFDFTRWNLDAVAPGTVSRVIAGLAQQFFDSPEWQESVQATMPQIQQAAVGVFKEHAQQLRESRQAAEANFERSTVTAKERADSMRRAMAAAAAPQTPAPTADAYHLSVRVTGADPALGFASVLVEIADPRDPKAAPVASASTDVDGNAVLTVGPELAKELDKRDTAISVTAPSGKLLARIADGVCVRVGQVETKVLNVKESADTAPLKDVAVATRANREALLESLTSRVPTLAQEQKTRLAGLDCRLHDADAMVAELQKPVDLGELFAGVKPSEPPPRGGGNDPRGGGTTPGGSPTRPIPSTPSATVTPATSATPVTPVSIAQPVAPAVRPVGVGAAPVTMPPEKGEAKPAAVKATSTTKKKAAATTKSSSSAKKK